MSVEDRIERGDWYGTLEHHGVRWRMRGLPIWDDDGDIVAVVDEPKWNETDLTEAHLAELATWVAEHQVARPQDTPDFVLYATLEHNGVEHMHRRGHPIFDERPAYGYECRMCKGMIVNTNPGDYRFRGGPADGRWIVTDGRPAFDVPVMPELRVAAMSAPLTQQTITSVTYYLRNGEYVVT